MKSHHVSARHPTRYVLFGLIVVGVVLYQLLPTTPPQFHGAGSMCTNGTRAAQHPVKQLHEDALAHFHAMLGRQSQNLENATIEYKQRYGRDPPYGFDEWFGLSSENGAVIFDEYDTIMDAMEPFWNLSHEEINTSFERAADGPSIHKLIIKDGNASVTEGNIEGEYLMHLLGKTTWDLPDVELLMNSMVEPRVLNRKSHSKDSDWETCVGSGAHVLQACDRQSKIGNSTTHPCSDMRGLPFVTDIKQAKDICHNQAYESQHGFLINSNLTTTNLKVPILSRASTSAFSDILYPSMYYWTMGIWRFDDFDLPWEQKSDKVYWAGATSGGQAMRKSFIGQPVEQHRMRFNRIGNQLGNETYQFLERNKLTSWNRYKSTNVMTHLYDTKFTEATECEEPECEQIRSQYVFAHPDEKRQWFQTKLIMDMDGKGVSGRFYNFLKSKSCPLKLSIFREWHDDRLVPWVHYIPVSVGMQELPELVRYLTSTVEGIRIAKTVADMGSEWHDKALRQEDAALYTYRLMLEYARVRHPGRDEKEMDMLPATSRYIAMID